jgi:hypothetical protein
MSKVPFTQRFGLEQSKPIDDDFPESARIALTHLMDALADMQYLTRQDRVLNELFRTGRFTGQEFDFSFEDPFFDRVLHVLQKMEWWQVYAFCERVYDHLLQSTGFYPDAQFEESWVETESISEVREHYTNELNDILAEENLAYHFLDGQFQRRGRAQTQKSIQRVGVVLADPSLTRVRNHYNKARKFFDERPEPDVENCIKETLCALEACLEILIKKGANKDFTKAIKQLQGNDPKQIPAPIAEGMIKLHAYRGSGQGVAHAALHGSRVSEVEAELVLNLVASYITYLVDLLSQPEEGIPF